MTKELKDQWLTALRSGEYKQGKGTLKQQQSPGTSDCTYCCLGVLCDIVGPENWSPTYSGKYKYTYPSLNSIFNDSYGTLPKSLSNKLEVSTATMEKLIKMNDAGLTPNTTLEKYTFLEIADWIENNL